MEEPFSFFLSHDTLSRVAFLFSNIFIYHLSFMSYAMMVSIGLTTLFYTGTGPLSRRDLPTMVSALAAHSFFQRVHHWFGPTRKKGSRHSPSYSCISLNKSWGCMVCL